MPGVKRKFASFTEVAVSRLSSVARVAAIAAMCILVAMMLLTTADVASRYLANAPIEGSYEIVGLLLVCLTAAALAYCHLEKGNVRVSIVMDRLPHRGQVVLDGLASLLGLVGVSAICWYAYLRAVKYIFLTRGAVTPIAGIVYYPFMFILFLGFVLLAIVLLINLLQSIDRAISNE